MPKLIDEEGNRYGRLIVQSRTEGRYNKYSQFAWKCICDCGNVCYVKGSSLRNGNTASCGCLHRDTVAERNYRHGFSKERVYRIYKGMKRRCESNGCEDYADYGGRGISLCDEWRGENGAENFIRWAYENGYSDDLTIDRMDVNGNYSPDNCRWADNTEQANNKRSNHLLEYNGQNHTISEWSKITGIKARTIEARLRMLGWSAEKTLTTPLRGTA